MKISSVDCVTELLAYTYHLIDQIQLQHPEYDQVSGNYDQLISRARSRAKAAGIPKNRFDDALFAIFAWIDETLLRTGWDQKNQWIRQSLQKRFFNTTNAGVEFFDRLDKFGEDEQDILEVYDYCLASGFKGRFYQSHEQDKLKAAKAAARQKLNRDETFEVPEILFPDAGSIEFSKPIKRKRWKGLSSFASIFVLLPILLFCLLYYFFNEQLFKMISDSGIL